MVIDFQDFTPFKLYLEKKFDHQIINSVIKQPTAENIAQHLYEYAADLFHVELVRVWESDTAYAEYRR
jgi:6-pyruvoyl-tetrahydropterin synthase